MIVGKKDIKAFFIKQHKKYFCIYRKGTEGDGNPICRNDDIEGQQPDPESALTDFSEWLSLLQTGDYALILNNSQKLSDRGGNREHFRIPLNESLASQVGDIQQPAASGIGGTYTMEDVMSKAKIMATEEFEKLTARREAEELKKQNETLLKEKADAEKRLEDPWNKFIGALAPHADKIVNGLIQPAKIVAPVLPLTSFLTKKVSGIEPDEHVEENSIAVEQTQHIFENFVTDLQIARPDDWLQVLAKMDEIIKNDPEKFNTALKFL